MSRSLRKIPWRSIVSVSGKSNSSTSTATRALPPKHTRIRRAVHPRKPPAVPTLPGYLATPSASHRDGRLGLERRPVDPAGSETHRHPTTDVGGPAEPGSVSAASRDSRVQPVWLSPVVVRARRTRPSPGERVAYLEHDQRERHEDPQLKDPVPAQLPAPVD